MDGVTVIRLSGMEAANVQEPEEKYLDARLRGHDERVLNSVTVTRLSGMGVANIRKPDN